jgi:predicted membrane protein
MINVEWFASVFLGVLLASTIGSVVSFYTIKALVKRDRDIKKLLKFVQKQKVKRNKIKV